jgi:choice-of-anchor B domain-containing protein
MIYSALSAFSLGALVSLASAENHCTGDCLRAEKPHDEPIMTAKGSMARKDRFWKHMQMNNQMGVAASDVSSKCVDGQAGEYACSGIDLASMISLKNLGCGGDGSDMWGWTDAESNEYALATCEDGTSFVDITDPYAPVVLGFLPTNTGKSWWWDVKVYKDYAFIGSEARNQGMSVFDLSQLTKLSKEYRSSSRFLTDKERNVTSHGHVSLDTTFKPNSVYTEVGSSHNIVMNVDTGYLYIVGSKTCDGGLHIVDVRDPGNPQFVACFASDGYTHDAECVVYAGPDSRFTDHEICFCYNEDTLTIVDVTDKAEMRMLSRQSYVGAAYTHQGSINPEMTHLFLNDELDEEEEAELDGHTRSMIWDVSKLDMPTLIGDFFSPEKSIDHNEYIHNGVTWQSNYCAGLRVLDARTMSTGKTTEVAYFDVSPECNTAIFMGAWSAYPFWKSGTVGVQSIERGLFLLKPTFKLE